MGVRHILPVWGSTSHIGGAWDSDEGLTDFGKEVIRECERLGIIVDVSHMSVKSFWDTVQNTKNPIVASHSNYKEISPHGRNLDRDQLALIIERGGIAGFIDAEHALDPVYAGNIGVDIDNLYISQPDSGEQALEIAETMVRSGAIDIVVIDSVAALVPKAEIDGEMGDSHVGLQARLMSQALRKLTGVISKSNCTVVFINQLREKVGIMFGNPETTTGGRALKFYSSIRLDVRRIESLKQSGEIIGNRTRVKVVKNKIAPPFKEAEFDIMFGKGISYTGDVLDLAANVDIVNKSGAWYNYNGEKIGQGRENTKKYLEDHPQTLYEIDRKVREHYGLDPEGARIPAPVEETAAETDAE